MIQGEDCALGERIVRRWYLDSSRRGGWTQVRLLS